MARNRYWHDEEWVAGCDTCGQRFSLWHYGMACGRCRFVGLYGVIVWLPNRETWTHKMGGDKDNGKAR